MKKILFALTIACALAISAIAHEGHDKKHDKKTTATKGQAAKTTFEGKGDGVETCPVSGEPIGNKDNKATLFGRTVYFCCADCLAEAKKNPAMYVKKTHKEQLAAIKGVKADEHSGHHADAKQADAKPAAGHGDHAMAQDKSTGATKFLGKGDGVTTCPVMGGPVDKSKKYEVDGNEFYVCCDDCVETIKKNPAAYLKNYKPAKVAFMGKGDGIETCPVTGEAVNKNLKNEVNGQTFYVCCESCVETVKKNPAAYLKKATK